MVRFRGRVVLAAVPGLFICLMAFQAQAQNPFPTAAPQTKALAASGTKFPLAVPAGQVSGQMTTPGLLCAALTLICSS